MPNGVKIVKINPVRGNAYLKARVDVAFPSGLVIHDISVFRRQDGNLSVNEPNAPMLKADGSPMTDNQGKRRYKPTISFQTEAAQKLWRKTVLDALAALPPQAID